MLNKKNGKKNWVFCDGVLPPPGDNPDFPGHESLMLANVGGKDADIRIEVIFEDKEPKKDITLKLSAKRMVCLRLDKPIGDQKYQIPQGQYTLVVRSSAPLCACFGRLDVRQANMAFYSVQGYAF